MNGQEIELKLNDHEHELKSLKHRVTEVEDQTKAIHDLAMSVEKLALNLNYMNDEQKSYVKRLETLESKPAKRWELLITSGITAIIGTIVGFILSNVL